jgi:hypothetical protein
MARYTEEMTKFSALWGCDTCHRKQLNYLACIHGHSVRYLENMCRGDVIAKVDTE